LRGHDVRFRSEIEKISGRSETKRVKFGKKINLTCLKLTTSMIEFFDAADHSFENLKSEEIKS